MRTESLYRLAKNGDEFVSVAMLLLQRAIKRRVPGYAFDAALQCISEKKLALYARFGFRQRRIRPMIDRPHSITRFNRKNAFPRQAIMLKQRRLQRRPAAFLRMEKNNAGFIARQKSVFYIPQQSH